MKMPVFYFKISDFHPLTSMMSSATMASIMLAIKLQRIGKKKQPSYRIVVAERRSKLGAPPVEDMGSYNSVTKKGSVAYDRVLYWVSKGAKPTTTALNLLVRLGALSSPKIAVKMKKKAVLEETAKAPEMSPEKAE